LDQRGLSDAWRWEKVNKKRGKTQERKRPTLPLWSVDLDNWTTLVRARTPKRAVEEAMQNFFGYVRAKRATQKEVDWHESMGGRE
jgi:hypothetical protein